MTKRAFIAGIGGQDGGYLARLLLEKGYEVHGGIYRRHDGTLDQLKELGALDQVTLHDFDLTRAAEVSGVLDGVAPDEVYNFAGPSSLSAAYAEPGRSAEIIGLGPIRILDWLRRRGASSRFYQASTAEIFAADAQVAPLSELTPFGPRNLYGIAKLFAQSAAADYRRMFGVFACCGIMFNHESPWRGLSFVTRKISHGFARIRYGLQDHIELGNLDAERDWGFAGDYVEAAWRMLQGDSPDDFVLATGEPYSVRNFAESVGAYFGWRLAWRGSGVDEEGYDKVSGRSLVKVNARLFRQTEALGLCGDASKATALLGWRPTARFEDIVRMMAEEDGRRVHRGQQAVARSGIARPLRASNRP